MKAAHNPGLAPPNHVKRFSLTTLALIPSFECDIVCDHCVFHSSPDKRGRLNLLKALEVISELRRISQVERVTVSGGEASLSPEYLYEVAEHTNKEGLKFRVVTNGNFGASLNEALDFLRPLSQIGIESLGISWDSFHQRFVRPERIKNVLDGCQKLGISARITFVSTKSNRLGPALELLGEYGFDIPLTEVSCLPVGRAKDKVDVSDLLPVPERYKGRSCSNDFDTLSVTADGSVYPCCAVGGFTSGIRLGSVHDSSMQELLEKRDNQLLWVLLARQGPRYFLRYASEQEKVELCVDDNLHDCAVCNRIFDSYLGKELIKRAKEDLNSEVSLLIQTIQDKLCHPTVASSLLDKGE
jgi:hypothetical protein